MPIVKMPNGQKVRFPDTMPRAKIREMILQKFPNTFDNQQPAEKPAFSLRPLTAEEKTEAALKAQEIRPKKTYEDYLVNNLADIAYGSKRALSGASFGASDWLGRRLGFDTDEKTYLQRRDDEGLGNAARAAGFASELGGNMLGAGGALVKGLAKTGLKGLKLASVSGGLEGTAYGATGADNLAELPANMVGGGIVGAALPFAVHGAGHGARAIAKPFSSRLMTAGMNGGLGNVSGNSVGIKLLRQGIRNNDDVAEAYLGRVRPELRGINNETAGMVDRSLTSRINVPETIASMRAGYGDYMAKHGADEVMDFAPRKYLSDIVPESGYNPNLGMSVDDARSLLKMRAKQSGLDVYGDVDHFTGSGRRKFIRTLNNTLEKPDITYTQKNPKGYIQDYTVKKYNNNMTGKPFYDLVFKREEKLFDKFDTNENYLLNQLKKPTENLSFSRHNSGNSELTSSLPRVYDDIITQNGLVVNSELPNVSTLYEGLTPFQSGQLDKALKTGLSKTNAKAGSLESLNKVKQELNEMISKAQSTDKPSEVWQLQELKTKFDGTMPEGLKTVDKGFERAKRFEEAFEKGAHYNPNNVSGADTIAALTPDEQNAFAQGLFKRINNNSLTGKSLADEALKYENTLSQVLSEDVYNPLMQSLNRQSTRFGRLSELGRTAESRLRTPEGTRFFGREQLESKGSLIGSSLDWANNLLRGRAIRRASLNLLNPEYVGRPLNNGWVVDKPAFAAGLSAVTDNWLMENYPSLANSVAAAVLKTPKR